MSYFTKIKHLIKTTITIIMISIVLLFVIEMLFGLYDYVSKKSGPSLNYYTLRLFEEKIYPYTFDPVMAWRHKENSPIVYKVKQDPLLPTNYQHDENTLLEYAYSDNLGFIPNKEGGQAIVDGREKLFMLGGSKVQWNAASDYDKTLPAYLEKFLTESYQDISVINAGVGGYHLSQEKS